MDQVQAHSKVQSHAKDKDYSKLAIRPQRVKTPPKFFSEEQISAFGYENNGSGNSTTISLHDKELIAQIGAIFNDVFDEIRNEYRITCVQQGIIKVGELPPPFIFQSTQCMKWVQTYYRTYSKLDSPDCYIPGTDPLEPKIDRKFKYYYQLGFFNAATKIGRLLTHCHQYCGIHLASNYGNRKNWILNPPR